MWQNIVELDVRADAYEEYCQLVAELNAEDEERKQVEETVQEDEYDMAA